MELTKPETRKNIVRGIRWGVFPFKLLVRVVKETPQIIHTLDIVLSWFLKVGGKTLW